MQSNLPENRYHGVAFAGMIMKRVGKDENITDEFVTVTAIKSLYRLPCQNDVFMSIAYSIGNRHD